MPRVMLWDFDRTLAYRDVGWSATMAELAIAEGVSLDPDAVRPHLAGAFPWDRPDADHRCFREAEAWWARMSAGIAEAYRACGVRDGLADTLAAGFRTAYLDPERWHVYGDTIPALQALEHAGWVHVICSNHVPELPQLVHALGLADCVKRVVSSALVGWEKPNPAIYRAALEGLARPSEAWMAGDNYEADVAGPQHLGIRGILVRREHPDAVVQYDDLATLAERLAANA
jgi:putative hydrolase of the HAD superfamily